MDAYTKALALDPQDHVLYRPAPLSPTAVASSQILGQIPVPKRFGLVSFLEYGRLGFEVIAFSHFVFFKRCFPLAQASPSGKVGASHPADHLRAKVLSGGSVPGEVKISYPHPLKHACQMPSLTET